MPACGNCGQPVAVSDITCPHCDALLAAYASPLGSAAMDTVPVPTVPIPPVDYSVPPVEVTTVTEGEGEPYSTAPEPLFDTYLTVEEIAQAAESDHDDEVVTIVNRPVVAKPASFDVPDYAKPPANAAPIPMVDDTVASPLVGDQADERTDSRGGPGTPIREPASPQPRARRIRTLDVADATPTEDDAVGTTDAYLRKLHQQTNYRTGQKAISRPLEGANVRKRREKTAPDADTPATVTPVRTGCSPIFQIMLGAMWLGVILSILNGDLNVGLLILTIVLSFMYRPVTNAARRVAQQ